MFYVILLLVFAAVGLAIFLLIEPIRDFLERSVFKQRERVARELEEMFILISVEGLQTIKLSLSAAFAVITMVLTWGAKPPFPFVVAGIFAIIGYWAPELVIAYLRKRRRAKFSEQLVDGLVLMGNGLRAGFTLLQAIDMLVEEMPAPMSQEFDLVRREYRVGVELDQALRNCVHRTKDQDLDLMVTATQITRHLGGNLSEVFDRIVAMVRERKILTGKAEALTSEGKLQAIVVGLLPYVFAFFMVKVNPDLMRLMWTTVPGFIALIGVVALDVFGYLWVRKVASIEY
jgi:tight adherence protein B